MSGPVGVQLAPMLSWQEFLDAAQAPESIPDGSGRHGDSAWSGASWADALRLAAEGWQQPLSEERVSVAALRERAGLTAPRLRLEPVWDVTGAEVDIGAYLGGEPECMVDLMPRRVSRVGKVVTFLIPAVYANTTPHAAIRHRGLALAALSAAIVAAGHSVEIWSGYAVHHGRPAARYTAMAKVISAGEPLDIGRLVFAAAHPAMLRRLWFAVWDGQERELARRLKEDRYGRPGYDCRAEDLPAESAAEAYVFPYLVPEHAQWRELGSALAWCRELFADLGLLNSTD
ncbi:hypothetical protein CFP65_6388 [Kitasatospora sp. MMS16-BH015]|uniref:DUF7192 family protein n=1 Tax=Kitasatospora sp. MMS16-BH015 TaxID=2018025 RepID=UPI000CA39D75|nr:hypothetical protein [Kitasatospora sp. MMS16-BH015]AUG81044.1 hypothetical protein CFP65_6388 [Kitasatospora sp. MMS16-BH015]